MLVGPLGPIGGHYEQKDYNPTNRWYRLIISSGNNFPNHWELSTIWTVNHCR